MFAMRLSSPKEMMLKISQRMGGLPSELSPVLQKIEDWREIYGSFSKRSSKGMWAMKHGKLQTFGGFHGT
jgi:hypothetical protein